MLLKTSVVHAVHTVIAVLDQRLPTASLADTLNLSIALRSMTKTPPTLYVVFYFTLFITKIL